MHGLTSQQQADERLRGYRAGYRGLPLDPNETPLFKEGHPLGVEAAVEAAFRRRRREIAEAAPGVFSSSDHMLSKHVSDRFDLVNELTRRLIAETQRGKAGHWTYDRTRHEGLRQNAEIELAELNALVMPRRAA